MNENNNNDVIRKLLNEADISEGKRAIKWGSTLMLILGVLSFVFVLITVIAVKDFLTPLDKLQLLSIPIILIICGIFARKGQLWAFILPVLAFAYDFIQSLISQNWSGAVTKAVIFIALIIALRKVIAHNKTLKGVSSSG